MITNQEAWDNLAFIQSFEHSKPKRKEVIKKLKQIQFYIEVSKDESFIDKIEDFQHLLKTTKTIDHWKLHSQAQKLFGKPRCFLCDREVIWSIEANTDETNGRMLNFTNSGELKEEEWKTICKRCLKRKVMKEQLEEGFTLN